MQHSTTQQYSSKNATDNSLIDSSQVEGTEVYDLRGKHIGSIKRLVIEKTSGRVVYTVMSFGGFLGMGANEFTIPWNKLRYDTQVGGFETDVTKEELEGAPAFARDRDDRKSFLDRDNERELNDYYGSSYYWAE